MSAIRPVLTRPSQPRAHWMFQLTSFMFAPLRNTGAAGRSIPHLMTG
jgi:hypothetical protein